MGGRRTSKPGATRWFPIEKNEAATLDALAADGEGVIADVEIEDRGTGIAYTGGAVVSYRLWCDIKPEAVLESMPNLHVFIVPAGEDIPSVATPTLLKQSQHMHWAMTKFKGGITGDMTSASVLSLFMQINTARRFRQADRFVVVIHNAGAVAFGAAAVGSILVDAYVRPD